MNKPWNNENKRPKTLFIPFVCLVLNVTFCLEHRKIKISDPHNLIRVRLRIETFEDNAPVSTRLANQKSTTSCKLGKGGGILIVNFYTA